MKTAVKFILLILVSFTAFSCSEKREPQPTVMVIFGATGDLTSKKILPAIDQLAQQGNLPQKFALVGVARKAEAEFRKQVHFDHKLFYNQADFNRDEGYRDLEKLIGQIDREFGAKSNRIYFLATQPSYFATIVEKLAEHKLLSPPQAKEWSRVVIEKPFGHDLPSALALEEKISQHLDESQIYLIDHYLGKEGVNNLICFRQSGALESIWDKEHIDHIDITLSEDIGIGARAKFWEETGLLRDVVQNHIMQLLSLVAMELPADAQSLPKEKIKVLHAIRALDLGAVVRKQYGPGSINGSPVVGYLQEKDVPKSSLAETFVAAELFIDNDRWEGVPFHIRSGKRLPTQITEIVVAFKSKEELHIRIQPKPAIFFKEAPEIIPGVIQESVLAARHSQNRFLNHGQYTFEPFPFSEAYQKLIYDCLQGDRSSFVQNEEQLAAWRLLTPVLEHWKTQDQIPIYPAGTWGGL